MVNYASDAMARLLLLRKGVFGGRKLGIASFQTDLVRAERLRQPAAPLGPST